MTEKSSSSFHWQDHLRFPVINEKGQQLPDEVVEEYMEEVGTLDEFTEAYRQLISHVILTRVSTRTMKAIEEDINNALNPGE